MPTRDMTVEINVDAGHSDAEVFTPVGDLDFVAASQLRAQLQVHLDQAADSGRWLILDLSQVDFVGSRALNVLVEARAAGALLRLRSAPRALRRLIAALRLSEVFPEVSTDSAAVADAAVPPAPPQGRSAWPTRALTAGAAQI